MCQINLAFPFMKVETPTSYSCEEICPQFETEIDLSEKSQAAGRPRPRQSREQDWQELGKAYEIHFMCFGCNQLLARYKGPRGHYEAEKQTGPWGRTVCAGILWVPVLHVAEKIFILSVVKEQGQQALELLR